MVAAATLARDGDRDLAVGGWSGVQLVVGWLDGRTAGLSKGRRAYIYIYIHIYIYIYIYILYIYIYMDIEYGHHLVDNITLFHTYKYLCTFECLYFTFARRQ